MSQMGICVGDKGCSVSDVISVISTILILHKNVWDIAIHLGTPPDIIERERVLVQQSGNQINPLETLANIMNAWVQRVTSEQSYLTTFLSALKKSRCSDMALQLKRKYRQPTNSPTTVPNYPTNCNMGSQTLTASLNRQNGALYSSVPGGMDNSSNENRRKCASTKPFLIWIGVMQVLLSAIIICLLVTPFYKNPTKENSCSTENHQLFWLNATSFHDYLSKATRAPLNQRIKLGIDLHSAYDWPPQSNIRNPCNIVELYISGNFNYFILVSLVRQLLYITLVTIETNDCPDVSKVDFVTNKKLELSSDRLQNIQIICVKPFIHERVDEKYQKLITTSFGDYKKQVSDLPAHLLLDVTLNISVPAAWPDIKVENLLRVRKLTLIGPFLKESLISILQQSKEIEELYIIDSVAGICKNSAKWHSMKKTQENVFPKNELVNLKILHFKNFADCSKIYEFFVINIRTEKLHTFRLENSVVSESNIKTIHKFLQVNCQSLEILHLVLKGWDVQFFNHLNTSFFRMTEIMVDFTTYEIIPKFLGGLLCDSYFPYLKKLILNSGYVPYDHINIILKCSKLQILDFAIYVPSEMEPLRMNIFKSVMRLPPNFTLGVHFVDKSPSDICEIEFIEGINLQPNCLLKDTG